MALLFVSAACGAIELHSQFTLRADAADDEEFVVHMQQNIEPECLSYYADHTPDQATIIIPWRLLERLAAPKAIADSSPGRGEELERGNQARELMQSAGYAKLNVWGCANVWLTSNSRSTISSA